MEKTYWWQRSVLGLLAAYHLILGGLMLFSGELTVKLLKLSMGANIMETPALGVVSEILACYILAFGLMIALAAVEPVKYRGLISIGIVLIAIRLFQWCFFAGDTIAVFNIAPGQYWTGGALLAAFGVCLSIFRWQINRDLPRGNPPV